MGKQKPTNRSCRRELMLKPRNVITLKSGVREREGERESSLVMLWNSCLKTLKFELLFWS